MTMLRRRDGDVPRMIVNIIQSESGNLTLLWAAPIDSPRNERAC